MKHYFALQYKIINRHFQDSGLKPMLAWTLLSGGFVGISALLFMKSEYASLIYVPMGLAAIGNLSALRRSEFLMLCFGDQNFRKIRLTENLLAAIPFIAVLCFNQSYAEAGVMVVVSGSMALWQFRSTMSLTIPTPFGKNPFEFVVGIRNTWYLIPGCYLLSGVALYSENFNVGMGSILLLFAIQLSYYTKPENEFYVWFFQASPRKFLLGKIKTAILHSSLLALPAALITCFAFPNYIHFIVLIFPLGWSFLTFMIVSKYVTFPDDLNITQGIMLVICVWFPPLLLVLIPYLFRKAEDRLSYLLKSEFQSDQFEIKQKHD